jgi:hypothetical protein
MATKTLRVFAEYTSTGFVPMPTAGNIDYGYTLGSTFPATTPTSFQTDNPDLVVTVTAMTDFYVWIRVNGQAWNPSYTRNVRVYPDSPNINNVVMNMIIATGPAGVSSYTQIVQTSNRLYFNGATTDSVYNSKFAGKTYINELNFGTAPGLATVATSGAYADLTGKPSLATVATSGLFTDLSSKPSGTAPLSYNSGTNSFVITQANTSTNGYLSSTDWNTFNNKFATPAGSTLQYVDGTGALQTFPVLASADKLVINVRNSSGVSMPKGSVVYINGATGNKPTVALAIANSDASSAQTLGLLQTTLANNAEGNVIIVGSVTDLNTSAFTEGQQLYLSPTTAGTYTATKQYAPNHLVYVGVVSRSHVSLGTIDVKVQNGYEMDELHNVSAQSPSNNDGLFYNTTTSLWEKKSISTVLGYTPYNGTDTSIKALFSASTPLSYSNGVYGISQATTASNGYLSSTDWNIFNGKESVLSFTTPLVRTTNTISINQASASTSGYLSSTDWNTFNNKSTTSGTVTSVAMTMPLGLSVSGSPITTSGTFGITLTAGYVIPSTTSTGQWDTAYTNRITSLTVTGSSGSATLSANVLNIPTYTLVGLGGQVALNGTGFVKATGTTISYDNSTYLTTASASSTYLTISTASSTYQTIITNPVTGTGTTNYIPKFTSSSAIGNSNLINDANGNLGLGVTPSAWSGIVAIQSAYGTLSGNTQSNILLNTYYDGSYRFVGTGYAARYRQDSGEHAWLTSTVSGTAGTAITFTQAMTLTSSGNLGLGNTPSAWSSIFRVNQIGNNGGFLVSRTDGINQIQLGVNGYFNGTNWIYTTTESATKYYQAGGVHYWETAPSGTTGTAITFTERMRITSAGLVGIGESNPGSILNIKSASPRFTIDTDGTTNTISSIYFRDASVGSSSRASISTAGQALTFGANGANVETMRLTSGGILGVGVIPQNWYSTVKGIQFSLGGSLWGIGASNNIFSSNEYLDTTNADSRYIGSDFATRYQQNAGDHKFSSAPAGTAGNLITFTERMQITSSGSIIARNNGQFRIEAVGNYRVNSNTNGLIGYMIRSGSWLGTSENDLAFATDGPYGISFFTDGSGTNRMKVNTSGNVSINYGADAGYRLYVSGAIYATSNITANSDLTLKKNLKLIDNPIDKLMQLNGYAYQWKSDDSHQYGVIAQEVEKILPYAVSTGNDGIKGVSYNQIIPVLIEAIKTQQAEINTLKSKLA